MATLAALPKMDLRFSKSLICEFCQEFDGLHSSRFARLYGSRTRSRIVASRDGLVAMPTLGQLFKGSMLILPIRHFETMAELPAPMREVLPVFVEHIEKAIQLFGNLVLFEHGAKCITGAGCGIYHAHLHIVPVPGELRCEDVLPRGARTRSDLAEAYTRLRDVDQYLLFRDTRGRIAAMETSDAQADEFPSQYFRRVLVDHFHLDRPWDWREYKHPELLLADTLKQFSGRYVSV